VNRRLYRCRHDRRIAGVASGVAEFFDLDPTVVRVVWFLSIFFGGLSILLYIAMAVIVPLEPISEADAAAEAAASAAAGSTGHRHVNRGTGGRLTTFFGFALVLFGGLALIDVLLPGWAHSWRFFWPVLVVGLGALLIAGGLRRDPDKGQNGEPTPE